jgi:hypothetical protein
LALRVARRRVNEQRRTRAWRRRLSGGAYRVWRVGGISKSVTGIMKYGVSSVSRKMAKKNGDVA